MAGIFITRRLTSTTLLRCRQKPRYRLTLRHHSVTVAAAQCSNNNYSNNKHFIILYGELSRNCQHRHFSQNTLHLHQNVSRSMQEGASVTRSENALKGDLPKSDSTALNGSPDDLESDLSGGSVPENDSNSIFSWRKKIISRLSYLGQELDEAVEQLFLPDDEIKSMVQAAKEVCAERKSTTSSQKADDVQDMADQLAFRVIRIRQMFFESEAEIKEKRQRLGNLLMSNVKESDAVDAKERHKHDVMIVKSHLNSLGVEFAKVASIERSECCDGHGNVPLVRIRVTSTFHTEHQIFKAQKKIRSKMRIIPDRTPLQLECDKHLGAEMIIRNQLSKLRRDPWDWIIRQNKVTHFIEFRKQSYDQETEALIRLADELGERGGKFKEWARKDKQEIELRRKIEKCVTIHNIEPCDSQDKETCDMHNMQQVRKICSDLGFRHRMIEGIEPIGLAESDARNSLPIRITLSDIEAKREFMMLSKNLKFGRYYGKKGVFVRPTMTFLQKYIDILKLNEVQVRNMILRRMNIRGEWQLQGGSIVLAD